MRRATAPFRQPTPARSSRPAPGARRNTAIFIVASPRPLVGKTFLARLLVDYLRLDGGEVAAFDLNPCGDALRDHLPALASAADVRDIKSQMALFDRLVVEDGIAKVVDVGHISFEQFFAVMEEIGFLREAVRQSIEATILFAADPHPTAVQAYADLGRRFRGAVLVPVLNEAILKGYDPGGRFASAAMPLRISVLPPMLKAQIEEARLSFADLHQELPMALPFGLAYELRAWTRRTFLELRQLELQHLLDKLRASLPGVEL